MPTKEKVRPIPLGERVYGWKGLQGDFAISALVCTGKHIHYPLPSTNTPGKWMKTISGERVYMPNVNEIYHGEGYHLFTRRGIHVVHTHIIHYYTDFYLAEADTTVGEAVWYGRPDTKAMYPCPILSEQDVFTCVVAKRVRLVKKVSLMQIIEVGFDPMKFAVDNLSLKRSK